MSSTPRKGAAVARVFSLLVVLFGGLLALLPMWLLPVCPYAEGMDPVMASRMPCATAGPLLAALGGAAVVSGLASMLVTGLGKRVAFAAAAVFGLLSILATTAWPGVCGSDTMPCAAGTRPGVWLAAGALFVCAAAGLWVARRSAGKPSRE